MGRLFFLNTNPSQDKFQHPNCKHIRICFHHNQDAPLVQRNLKFQQSHQHIRFLDKLDKGHISFPIRDLNRHNTLDIQEHLYIPHLHNSPRHILCLLHKCCCNQHTNGFDSNIHLDNLHSHRKQQLDLFHHQNDHQSKTPYDLFLDYNRFLEPMFYPLGRDDNYLQP